MKTIALADTTNSKHTGIIHNTTKIENNSVLHNTTNTCPKQILILRGWDIDGSQPVQNNKTR